LTLSSPSAPETLPASRARVVPRVLLRLAAMALNYPWYCVFALICTLGATVFTLLTPRLLGLAVDQLHLLGTEQGVDVPGSPTGLVSLAVLIVMVAALRGLLTGLQGFLGEATAQNIGHDLRLAFFDKLQRLSFDFHDKNHSGDLIARGMLDLEGCRGFLESGILRAVTLILLLGLGTWQVLSADLVLGLLSLSFVPIVLITAGRMGYVLRLTWTRLQEYMSEMSLKMEESLQGMRVVRAFSAKDFELAKFDEVGIRALKISNQRIAIRMRSISLMNFMYYLSMALVLLVGGRKVMEGVITIGLLTEVITFMAILQQPVRQVGMIVNSSARASSSAKRLFEVLDCEPSLRDLPGAQPLRQPDGVLQFDKVSFAYPSARDVPVLKNVSFKLEPGKTLAVVGMSGSGKSTLARLIGRFYDVSSGRISIGDQDIRHVTLDSLRQSVSLVQQETFLFDISAADNIRYGRPDADIHQVTQVGNAAQIDADLTVFRQGYATRVGERGSRLSGGQRQRLSIARGLLVEPSILILDDTTSALDSLTEQKVRQALREQADNKACIIIAHRLSSVMHADEILVLEAGAIVERGCHDQLLAKKGFYHYLWQLQAGTLSLPDLNVDQDLLGRSRQQFVQGVPS